MKRLLFGAVVILVAGVAAYANPMSNVSIGPGHSWVVQWDDGNYSGQYDTVEFIITSGNATFDSSATVQGISGTWTTTTSTVTGSFGLTDTTMDLNFTDPEVQKGVQVSVLYFENGQLLTGAGFNWQWLDLPGNQSTTQGDGWQYLPVPDGGLTSMLLGMGLVGLGWVRRQVKP